MALESGYTSAEKEGFREQGKLIHLMLAYHRDRVKNEHPFAIGNIPENSGGTEETMHTVQKNIEKIGLKEFNLRERVLNTENANVVQMLSQGVVASIWTSLNHLLFKKSESVDARYADFHRSASKYFNLSIANAHIRTIAAQEHFESDRYMGPLTLHSGVQVGVGNMTFLSALKYGLSEGHRFDPVAVSHIMSRANDVSLQVLGGQQSLALVMPHSNPLTEYVSDTNHYGVPPEKFREICVPKALGCPAGQTMDPDIVEVLERHNLLGDYDPQDPQSAIRILGEDIRKFVFEQLDILLSTLTEKEQEKHIGLGNRMLFDGSWRNLPRST